MTNPADEPDERAGKPASLVPGVVLLILAGVLIASGSGPGTVLVVEVLLLALFMAFWIVQTREAWTDLHTDPSGQR